MSFFKSLFGRKKPAEAAGNTVTLPNGDTYNGAWQGNLMHGMGEYNFSSTGEKYIGEFAKGKFSGQGRFYYRNGYVYDGCFSNGKRDGNGTMTYPNGDRYEGNWIADKRIGYGKMYYADGRVFRGNFLGDDMTDGFMTMKNENGTWQEVRYGTEVDYTAAPVVMLVSYPADRKMQIIKEIREYTECGLAHAKDISENTPQPLKFRASPEDIQNAIDRFEPLGAVIQIK